MTPYTINGLSIISEFTIAVRIEMEPMGIFNRTVEFKEEEIPIIIRAEKDASHIIDIM